MDAREKLVALFYENNVRCDQKIEGLADDVIDIIAHSITTHEWISVKDRLPEKDGGYLVVINYFGNHQSINVRYFAKAGETVNEYDLAGEKNVWYRYDSEYGYVSTDYVTHWMPLPQPPKGE